MRIAGRPIPLVCLFVALAGCAHEPSAGRPTPGPAPAARAATLDEPRYTYHEFDMIVAFFKTEDLSRYRQLLPRPFQMPADPMVMVFVADYYKMDRATQPYQEAAVFLLVDYQGKPAWHCVTMPVTSDEARLGGIYYLGFPKIMGEIALRREASRYGGTLKLKNKQIFSLDLETDCHRISDEEKQIFERLKGVPSLTIKDGRVFEPKFGERSGRYTLLQLAEMYPDKFEVKVGKPDLAMDAAAAADYSDRLGAIFSIRPSKIVLGYYFKNKFVMRFKN